MAQKDIAIVIHDGVQALDVAGPLDVFAEANGFLKDGEGYHCRLVARDTATMRASNGMLLQADLGFAEATARFHTVLVAGGPQLPGLPADTEMCDWLQRWAVRADRYGSICTGAFALGHAGLLDGRVVTTHWQDAAKLASMFPRARVEHDRIFSRDGALVTSAGITAGMDLTLALVTEDHGAEIALACAKRLLVVTQRQGGQSQFSSLLMPPGGTETKLSRVQAYVMDHANEPFPAERLAEIAGTSTRNIARLFVTELGITPHEFVERIRIERARNLLEATELAVKVVAFECGFATPNQMRNAFQRRLGLTPQRYRGNFRPASKP